MNDVSSQSAHFIKSSVNVIKHGLRKRFVISGVDCILNDYVVCMTSALVELSGTK